MDKISVIDRDFLYSDFGEYKTITDYANKFKHIAFDEDKSTKDKKRELENLQRSVESEMILGELYIIEDSINRSSNEFDKDYQFVTYLRELHTIIINYYYSLYDNE